VNDANSSGMGSNLFGSPLAKDPTVALPAVRLQSPTAPGPVRKIQFVIEIVGPRTVPAPTVQAILQLHWQQALGHPQAFVMAGSDQNWRPLTPNDGSGAYDSLALAWDLITPIGDLTAPVAQKLWDAAEDFAKQVGRRAIAIPIPQDVPHNAGVLRQLRESLDIGFNLTVTPASRPLEEKEIWRVAAALGLDYSTNGSFVWKAEGSELPLFEVFPGGEAERFLLSQVQAGAQHPCIGLGFSVPLCPDPMTAIDGCLKAGLVFADRLRALLLDEDDRPVNDQSKVKLAKNLEQAVGALNRAGIAPGSIEALKLFAV